MKKIGGLIAVLGLISCADSTNNTATDSPVEDSTKIATDTVVTKKPDYCNDEVMVGAEQTDIYLPLLKNKRVGIIGNQSSMIGETHLVDSLLSLGINVVKVFSPEHGFRGKADAGETVKDGTDQKTGLPIISLYGSNKKPKSSQLDDLDVLLFDIQDVGARFYTYISTLTYLMEAAAENGKELIVLDRPNPNGHYVAGPVLDPGFSSFVGMHPIPVIHGMTIGEYTKMVDGEGWISTKLNEQLTVVTCKNWNHSKFYKLPVAPSPNLPNMRSVYLYPSLCLFEGTIVSVGRGTDHPFQQIGHPDFEVDVLENLNSFKPAPNEGSSNPKLNGQTCYGYSFKDLSLDELRDFGFDLSYLLKFYEKIGSDNFFLSNGFINNLAGTDQLKKQIEKGFSLDEIEKSWEEDLEKFRQIRQKYLLYKTDD